MRTACFRVLSLSLLLAACGGEAEDPDAGVEDAGAEPSDAGADGGVIQADAGSDAGATDAGQDAGTPDDDGGASGSSVRWITEVEPRTIDGDVGLDFAFEYEVVLDGSFPYTLAIQQCRRLAGMAETCTTDMLGTASAGTSRLRTGIDPSTYAVGENRYTYRLMLAEGTTVVAEDTLELLLTVTSCEACVGGSGAP